MHQKAKQYRTNTWHGVMHIWISSRMCISLDLLNLTSHEHPQIVCAHRLASEDQGSLESSDNEEIGPLERTHTVFELQPEECEDEISCWS